MLGLKLELAETRDDKSEGCDERDGWDDSEGRIGCDCGKECVWIGNWVVTGKGLCVECDECGVLRVGEVSAGAC